MGFSDIFKIGYFKAEIEQLKLDNQRLSDENQTMHQQLQDIGAFDYYQVKNMIKQLESEYSDKLLRLKDEFDAQERTYKKTLQEKIETLEQTANDRDIKCKEILERLNELMLQEAKLNKNVKTQTNKLAKSRELVKAIDYALSCYFNYEPNQTSCKITPDQISELEELSPSVILKLHCMDMKDLRKAYRDNDKQINQVLDKYAARYTTKANQAIYKLMVIALRAELQNILCNLKYEKLDKSIDDVKAVTQKYLKIAGEGNQSIVGTLTKFIGEIEYLFINAVKIEYNYYVKKEQAHQEQLAIREQMRQEAEERKALEAEKKKVEQEESKYNSQIEKLKEQLNSASESELGKLNARILELQAQLAEVVVK